ncbi:MAG: FAD-dependent oxidoreductase, partial [Planctomycetota bacterium]
MSEDNMSTENKTESSTTPARPNSTAEYDYDLLVIGTGPGGEGAAMQCAKAGMRVAVAERYRQIGGGCTHWGTIPSKSLRHAITATVSALNNVTLRELGMNARPTLDQLRRGTKGTIAKQVTMRQSFYDRNNIPILRGQARFVDQHRVSIDGDEPVSAKHFVIATGSRPFQPAKVDFKHPRIYDSDSVLEMTHKPSSMCIYGAGVIGVEYASMFRNLGIKVNLINTREKLLEFLDDEIIDAISYFLRDQGVIIRHSEQMAKVEGGDDGVILHLKSGKQVKT